MTRTRPGQDETRVTHEGSKSARAERKAITDILARLEPLLMSKALPVSKWTPLIATCFAANGIRPGNDEQAVIFTEYADSADWIVTRLRADGFTAERYSGRDNQAARDQVRAEFMARRFQVIVSTDAGNEGIDLQSAHVLVNYDIPWSLVRLEQRMGRIHRIGQTRDVQLYNLVAQGTREGDVLAVLLDNFVTAANQLSGQMFDSLSLVAELAGLTEGRLSGLLADTYGDDEDRRAVALSAVKTITAAQLRGEAEKARRIEVALASTVDVAAAIQRLNVDTLERINPTIVEAYLARLADAKVIELVKTAAAEGILRLASLAGTLPPGLGGQRAVLIATSGNALTDAQASGATLSNVVSLGPGEPGFGDLVGYAQHAVAADVFRGGLVADPTAIADYDLYAFAGTMAEADGQRTTPWVTLVRVDETGARKVAWEVLANLVPHPGVAGTLHPARVMDAQACANQLASDEQEKRRAAMQTWLAQAEHELRDLPSKISRDIIDHDERLKVRASIRQMVGKRLDDLRRMADLTITDVRLAAHLRVRAAGIPPEPTEKDSERATSGRGSGIPRVRALVWSIRARRHTMLATPTSRPCWQQESAWRWSRKGSVTRSR